MSSTPATCVTTCIVRPGSEAAFADWLAAMTALAAGQAGFLQQVRLEQAGGQVHVLTTFADRATLDAWRSLPAVQQLDARAIGLAATRQAIEAGCQLTFTLPAGASGAKWRRFLVTWAAVFPTLLALNGLLQLVPFTLPLFARLAISSPLLTAALTWLILPRVNRWTRTWRLTDSDGRPSQSG